MISFAWVTAIGLAAVSRKQVNLHARCGKFENIGRHCSNIDLGSPEWLCDSRIAREDRPRTRSSRARRNWLPPATLSLRLKEIAALVIEPPVSCDSPSPPLCRRRSVPKPARCLRSKTLGRAPSSSVPFPPAVRKSHRSNRGEQARIILRASEIERIRPRFWLRSRYFGLNR